MAKHATDLSRMKAIVSGNQIKNGLNAEKVLNKEEG